MKKMILSVLAALVVAAVTTTSATALTVPRPSPDDVASQITPVRDGCGWRRHYSPAARRCVWDQRRWWY